jgi:hypothetical protein
MFMTAPKAIETSVVDLFDRYGEAPKGPVHFNEKGKPYWMAPRKCGRCGGEGRCEKWSATGYTCFDCHGTGTHKNGPIAVSLYTPEQNAKLDAARAKVRARKVAKVQAEREAAEKRAEDNRAEFQAKYGDMIRRAWAYLGARYGWDEVDGGTVEQIGWGAESNFVHSIITKAARLSEITQGQVDAVEKELARWDALQAAKRASQWVGKTGDKLTLTVEVIVATEYERKKFNAPWLTEWVGIRVLRDENGNTFKVVSTSFYPKRGTKLVIAGKVKDHEEYKGEKQTVLNYVKIKEVLFKPESTDEDDD